MLYLIILLFISNASANSLLTLQAVYIGQQESRIKYVLKDTPSEGPETNEQLHYLPNSKNLLTLGLSFNDFAISLTTDIAGYALEEVELEETNSLDVQLFIERGNYLWQLFYQNYLGLYIQKEDQLDSKATDRANSYSYGLGFSYYSNDRFKIKHAFSTFEFKKMTSWSLVHSVKAVKQKLWSNNGLVPTSLSADFEQLEGLKSIESAGLAYDFGVIGTYATKSFFATAQLGIGMILSQQSVTGIDQADRYISASSLNSILDFGINTSGRTILALQIFFESTDNPVRFATYSRNRTISTLFFKYYF